MNLKGRSLITSELMNRSGGPRSRNCKSRLQQTGWAESREIKKWLLEEMRKQTENLITCQIRTNSKKQGKPWVLNNCLMNEWNDAFTRKVAPKLLGSSIYIIFFFNNVAFQKFNISILILDWWSSKKLIHSSPWYLFNSFFHSLNQDSLTISNVKCYSENTMVSK